MEISNKKYLLLDQQIIENTDYVTLELGTIVKDINNPLFGEDKPWEVRFDNLYPNTIYDEEQKIYKCWYSPFIVSPAERKVPPEKRKKIKYIDAGMFPREMAVCYATSEDGIRWNKPNLGVVEFNGSKQNNIVYRCWNGVDDDGVHGAGIFKDTHDNNINRRYKMFFANGLKTIAVAFSPDGIHWSNPIPCENIRAIGDTHNNALWDPECEKYIGITRLWNTENHNKHIRLVGHTESKDFINWTKAKMVFDGNNPDRQLYSMPIFRYADLYLGLISILEEQTDLVRCELAYSRDTITWHRICPGKEFIPLGKKGDYDCGCIYAAATPICLEDEIRIYYAGSDGYHTNWRNGFFCLARLRKDGFAGYASQSDKRGTIITRPVRFTGNHIAVTADIESNGSIIVSIVDNKENIIDTSAPIETNVTDKTVTWKNHTDITRLKEQTIRLRFELTRAKLYSFSFIDSH